MCAVVGPNGCGKSNIIDAVRWVMGESSAKNLRGESMADVIFNGSGNRQPVGQASIELCFDNSDGGIGGEYAGYSEISTRGRSPATASPNTFSTARAADAATSRISFSARASGRAATRSSSRA
jgi:recombinational DNA repair ATPase RecF